MNILFFKWTTKFIIYCLKSGFQKKKSWVIPIGCIVYINPWFYASSIVHFWSFSIIMQYSYPTFIFWKEVHICHHSHQHVHRHVIDRNYHTMCRHFALRMLPLVSAEAGVTSTASSAVLPVTFNSCSRVCYDLIMQSELLL